MNRKPFVDGIGTIHFYKAGTSTHQTWEVGCDAANDTEDTLRAHAARWFPMMVVERIEIRPVKRAANDDDDD